VGNCIAYVVDKGIEEQGPQDRSLRHTGKNYERRRKSTRNTVLRFLVRQVASKPVYIAARKPKCTKLVKKKRLLDKVKCIAKIKINGISLSLRAN
jgi:hypothetical protein